MSCLAGGVHAVVSAKREQEQERRWCPARVKQSRTETVSLEERVSLVAVPPFEGVFVRQWGSEGSGEGEFNVPRGMCVSGEEVFVCDKLNHRTQVFSRDVFAAGRRS